MGIMTKKPHNKRLKRANFEVWMKGVEERNSIAARACMREYKKGGKHGTKQKPEETAERITKQVEERMALFYKEIGLDD